MNKKIIGVIITSLVSVAAFFSLKPVLKQEDTAKVYIYKDRGIDWEIYYSDEYFDHLATKYDSHLATLSMYMTRFSMNYDYPSSNNDIKWYQNQPNAVKGFLDMIGFKDFETNEDYRKRPDFDTIGIAAANKKMKDCTVIAVVPRSGGYFREWGNNVWMGDGSKSDYMHEGWYNAANKMINFINDYAKQKNITGRVKLWIAGYSRGGAVANIAAALIDNKINNGEKVFEGDISISHDDLYAYTIATPQGANINSKTVKPPQHEIYNNIWNIINPNDMITKTAPSIFGFTRFGIDKFITTEFFDPDNFQENRDTFKALVKVEDYKADDFVVYSITGSEDQTKVHYDANIATIKLVEELMSNVGTRENYVKIYQTPAKELLTHIKNDDLVVAKDVNDKLLDTLIVKITPKSWLGVIGEKNYDEQYGEWLDPLIPMARDAAIEIPNEVYSIYKQASNIFQNHDPDVNLAHIQAQDSYYIGAFNDKNTDKIKIVPLRNNADMGRMSFIDFNDLKLEVGDSTKINIGGYIVGKSDISQCDKGYACGCYYYAASEGVELFFPIDNHYKITMKSYSGKLSHEIEYRAYYQPARGPKEQIDYYSDKVMFNSNVIERNIYIGKEK